MLLGEEEGAWAILLYLLLVVEMRCISSLESCLQSCQHHPDFILATLQLPIIVNSMETVCNDLTVCAVENRLYCGSKEGMRIEQ